MLEAMLEILREYSDKVQIFSIDECFMDMTCMHSLLGGDYKKIAEEIKNRIKNELGFTVSIGISTNKLLAKMGSDLEKPDAVVTLFPEEIKEKMWPLPVRDLYMCGNATEKKLHSMGIYTIGDLAHAEPRYLIYKLKIWREMLYNFAH